MLLYPICWLLTKIGPPLSPSASCRCTAQDVALRQVQFDTANDVCPHCPIPRALPRIHRLLAHWMGTYKPRPCVDTPLVHWCVPLEFKETCYILAFLGVPRPRMKSANDLFRAKAHWETTSRLLATLINEGLVNFDTTRGELENDLHVRISPRDEIEGYDHHSLLVRVRRESGDNALEAQVSRSLSPEDLQLPLVLNTTGGPVYNQLANSDPETLFESIFPWLGYGSTCKAQIIKELRSSASFQGTSFS